MNELQRTMYRQSVCWRVKKIIAGDFVNATLITLRCSSPVAMPPELAKKVYRTWKATAQRIAGGPFNCLRIVDYGPHSIPGIVFHVVADLPRAVCLEICGAWYMGEASAVPLDTHGMERLTASIIRQNSKPKAQLWSYCKGTPHTSGVALAQ